LFVDFLAHGCVENWSCMIISIAEGLGISIMLFSVFKLKVSCRLKESLSRLLFREEFSLLYSPLNPLASHFQLTMSQKRALLVLCYFGLIEMTKLATKMNTSFIIWQNLVRLSEVLALSLVFLFDLISLVLFSTLSLANHCMDDFFYSFSVSSSHVGLWELLYD